MDEEKKLAELILRIRTASIRPVDDQNAHMGKREMVQRVLRQLSKFYDPLDERDRNADDK